MARANTLFDPEREIIYGNDILYNNDVAKWQRFCNSLRLRLLLRMSEKPEMDAYEKMAAIIHNLDEYRVFTSNEEAAILEISGVPPLVSPWSRAVDFRTGRAASAFFIDYLNALNDPRWEKFFTQAMLKDGITPIGYKGIPSGYAGDDSQFDFVPSSMSIALVTAPMISVIMSCAEVEFIKAELAQQGIISSDAQTHYQNGVEAAVAQWGAELPADYFDNPAAAYEGTLERIMLQKYLALYFNDYQQWLEYRRTGFPVSPKQRPCRMTR